MATIASGSSVMGGIIAKAFEKVRGVSTRCKFEIGRKSGFYVGEVEREAD